MSERDAKVMLTEVLESIDAIHVYLDGVRHDDFAKSPLLQDAVIRRLEVIGEAANQIPETVKQRFPLVEWREITAMRNRLIHAYFSVNIDIVWSTVEQDLQGLKTQAQDMLTALQQEAQEG